MPEAPNSQRSDLVSFEVLIEGQELTGEYDITEIEIRKGVNRISQVKIEILDGNPSEQSFPVSEEGHFEPGNKIKVNLGYHQETECIFEGIIVGQGLKIRTNGSALILKCSDEAVKMTLGRKNRYFKDVNDSQAIAEVIEENGLIADTESTTYTHKKIVQYYATDWDFMLSRAEMNGQIVVVDNNKVIIKKPALSESPELELTYGMGIMKMNIDIDARSQFPSVEAISWDMSAQDIVEESSSEPSINSQGNLTPQNIASNIYGRVAYQLQSTTPLESSLLKQWADATLLKSRIARIKGSITCVGTAKAKPNTLVKLGGIGDRFNGDAFVAGVVHKVKNGAWTSELHFGLSEQWFTATQPDVVAPAAMGLLPGIEGLYIGVVKQIENDPDGETRILVDVPVIEPTGEGLWARITNPYATSTSGTFFMPEVGDEVVLGFLNNDPRFPIILGSLYSSAHEPPFTPDADNTIKGIVTREQMKVVFDEEKKRIEIETPAGNIMHFQDDTEEILIQDKHGNKIQMSQNGIDIISIKDINIEAQGDINIKAPMAINVQADIETNVSAVKIGIQADAELKCSGKGSAEFSSSGMTTIKGSIVMIN